MRTLLLITSYLLTILQPQAQIAISHDSGFYSAPIEVSFQHPDPGVILFYSLDGTAPGRDGQRYFSPLLITSIATSPTLSYIRTGEDWQRPSGSVFKGHTLKVVGFKNENQVTPVVSRSYFIHPDHEEKYPLDRLALTIDSADFFGLKRGIYVPGNNEMLNFYQGGEAWERPVYFELFDNTGKLEWSQQLGARIHGRSSRTNPQKSLRLYARNEYGSAFMFHPLFGEYGASAQKRLILRAPDRLFSKAIFIDEVVHAAAEDLSVENMASRPVAVFINGEYWGLQNLRERHDEQYLRIKYGVEPDNVDIIDWDRGPAVAEGNLTEYNSLLSFLASTDISTPKGYQELKKRVNMDSFIPFVGTHLFFANEDFPNNNLRMWRERTYGEKWNFFFYDCDGCMRDMEMDSFRMFSEMKNDGNPASIMIRALLKNSEFTSELYSYLNNAMANQFSTSQLLNLISDRESFYAPLITDHINRWHSPDDTAEWFSAITVAEQFAMNRPRIMGELLEKHLGKPYVIYPIPAKTEFYLEFENNPEDMDVHVSISDMNGKTFSPARIYTSESRVNIPLEGISQGVYLIQVIVGKSIYYDKLIVTN
ncbi:MAG: CotH kinase family protein [Flavobacteriales bacterium]|jgi:hypothetical protein